MSKQELDNLISLNDLCKETIKSVFAEIANEPLIEELVRNNGMGEETIDHISYDFDDGISLHIYIDSWHCRDNFEKYYCKYYDNILSALREELPQCTLYLEFK